MSKYLLILTFTILSFNSFSADLINDEKVKLQKNCFRAVFSNYNSWRGFIENKRQKKIKSAEKLAKGMLVFDARFGDEKFNHYKENLSCRTFKYQVDGHEVSGYIIKPKLSDKKLPVLIYNRGGNGHYGYVNFGSMMHNLFPVANEGFVIIGSQYRLSRSKNTLLDEFGGKDVNDVIALLDFIPNIEGAEPLKVGMYGASRGGMQTFLALKETNKVKAIATIAGNSDLLKGLEYRPAMEKVYKRRIPEYQKNKVAELKKRSVLSWVNDLSPDVPILLLHGTDDKRVSANHSIDLAKALSKNHIPHKLILYPEDDHGLSYNKIKANKELVSWFQRYL